MDFCKGLSDWFYCLRCPFLCTKSCPIESEDAFRQFSEKLKNNYKDTTKESEDNTRDI